MPTTPPTLQDRPLRIGFLPLLDAAPLVAAQELGFFAKQGLRVTLVREPGWATLRDKIIYGELEAAHALAGLLWSTQIGLDCVATDVLTACVLNLHGNAITLSRALWDAGVRDNAAFKAEVRRRRGERRVTLGVVLQCSSHNVFLRSWLRSAGVDPQRDVRIVVLPPAQMFRNLAAGTIDGYCVGEPWNTLAVQQGAGWCPAVSASFMPGHVEKVLMVRTEFAAQRAAEHAALVAGLHAAAEWCDRRANRGALARMLAERRFLNVDESVLRPALLGGFDTGAGEKLPADDFLIFSAGDAGAPTLARGRSVQRDLAAAGLLPPTLDERLPAKLFREDLHRNALKLLTTHATVPA